MEMFGNAAAAASLVHAGLSAGGLSDHLAGLEACASLSNTGFGINTPNSNLTETTNPLVGLATSSVLASGRIGSHSNASLPNTSSSSHNSHYNNSNPYSVNHQNQTLSNCHPYQQASSLYHHNNYTSSAVSSLGYQDSLSNSFPGLAYSGVSTNHASAQQRLFSNPSLAASTPTANNISDSLLSEENPLNSSLLSSASSAANKVPDLNDKLRKDSNYSPSNISSSFLPSSTVKIKSGNYE